MPVSLEEFKKAFSLLDTADESVPNAVELISRHIKLVKGLSFTDTIPTLKKELDAAQATVTKLSSMDDVTVQSHLEMLKKELPPVERLLQNLLKEDAKKKLPKGRADLRKAIVDGDLATKLQDETFRNEVIEWVKKANPKDMDEKSEMLAAFHGLPESESAIRQLVFEKTFQTEVKQSITRKFEPILSGRTGKPLSDGKGGFRMTEVLDNSAPIDPKALTKMVDIMSQIPSEHIPPGWHFEGQNGDTFSRGSYNDDTDQAQFAYSLTDAANGFTQDYSSNCEPGDPLAESTAFDVLIRHECGHKAASVVGSDALTDTAAGGEWIHHDTVENVLAAIPGVVNDFVSKVQSAGQPEPTAIKKAVCNPDYGFDAEAIAEGLGIPGSRVPADHQLLKVLQQGAYKRYLCGTSPEVVGDRMFVVGGPEAGSWFSFSKATWDKRVSYYQYAAPNEWFAEFYATANNGNPKVREAAKTRYPAAYKWFEDHDCIVVK